MERNPLRVRSFKNGGMQTLAHRVAVLVRNSAINSAFATSPVHFPTEMWLVINSKTKSVAAFKAINFTDRPSYASNELACHMSNGCWVIELAHVQDRLQIREANDAIARARNGIDKTAILLHCELCTSAGDYKLTLL